MKLRSIAIQNFRSIVESGEVPLRSMFALVGENNCGKSNVLKSVTALITGGAGGIKKDDFFNPEEKIVIRGVFGSLTSADKAAWRKYLVKDELILEKVIWIETARNAAGLSIKSEYHGYESEPVELHLSIKKILESSKGTPKWANIASHAGLPEYFYPDGKSNKTIYTKALSQFLSENDVDFDDPDISDTQALGFQSNVVKNLPSLYLLPAITDYSNEIDKRQSTSTFRRLMGELSERILKNDPRYEEIEDSLENVSRLLNSLGDGGGEGRLEALGTIEKQIADLLKKLMPTVDSVSLTVEIAEIKDLFSDGVGLTIDDGVETDVLAKGNGLQRCVVFSLLSTLIETQRESNDDEVQSIILAIEEPELYIHPQLSKLFFDVMSDFSKTDQVIYTTHSPIFVEAYTYQNIGIVSKPTVEEGTKIITCDSSALDAMPDAKVFKGLSRFNASVSELFFAKRVLIVEGPEDLIGVTAALRKQNLIRNRPEEIEWSILVAGGKDAIPFFQLIANSFSIPHAVLHDLDIAEGMEDSQRQIQEAKNKRIQDNKGDGAIFTFPSKMEDTLGLTHHLKDQYGAHEYFSDPANINEEFIGVILPIFD